MAVSVEYLSEGKVPDKNEDFYGYNDTTFVVADGSTDKSGQLYDGKTGGYIASHTAVEQTLTSDLSGQELIAAINNALQELYKTINPRAFEDGVYRFSCTLVAARVVGENLVITHVGDTGFRVNGCEVHNNVKLVDELNAAARAYYIEKTGDIPGSRDYILPLLRENQRQYANSPDVLLGYGTVNGTPIPDKFVKNFTIPLKNIQTLEIFTDGYFAIPEEVSVKAWEAKYEEVEHEDPDKYLKYKSAKSKDDRTVMIIKF